MAEKSQKVLRKVKNDSHVTPWWLLTIRFCSHYQGHIIGCAMKLFTRTFNKKKINGFCLLAFGGHGHS